MNYWIFPSNLDEFNSIEHFKQDKQVEWRQVKQSQSAKIGDIVFMYITQNDGKYSQTLALQAKIVDVKKTEYPIVLELVKFFQTPIPLKYLQTIGIVNIRAPRTITKEQADKIFEFASTSNSIDKEQEMPNNIQNKTAKNPPLNQILYGPPGTGKTYNTINKALEILGVETQGKSRAELKATFDEFRQNGQIEFITFHQSFSYEEFVEGIKPKLIDSSEGAESGKMEYEIKSGIFKQICKKALQNLENSQKDEAELKNESKVDNLFEAFIEHIQNEQENGGEYILKQNAEKDKNWLVVLLDWGIYKVIKIFSHSGFLATQPVFLNRDKIKAYYSNFKADNSFKIPSNENRTGYIDTHRFYTAFFKKMQEFESDWQDSNKDSGEIDFNQKALKRYILIIDEINRGNISKILGELITLIEPSKRIGGDEELRVSLPYSANEFDGGKGFGVPKNLYIIGTMNTADRSIALLDTALRRRFEFVEMMPDCEHKAISTDCQSVNLQELLKAMNARIEFLLDREHTIGHSFFINVNSLSELKQVFKNKIIPLLQEYFYDDYAKIDAVLNGNKMVKDFSKNDLQVNLSDDFVDSDKKIYRITKSSKWNEKNFLRIYDDSVQIDKDGQE